MNHLALDARVEIGRWFVYARLRYVSLPRKCLSLCLAFRSFFDDHVWILITPPSLKE